MTLTEQTEMDAFLEEAPATGRIRQSKSPLGAPVFFIKKDGKLRTIEHSMPSCEKIDTPSPSSTISSIDSRTRDTSPSLTYNGDTIMSASERVMSGSPHFEQIGVSSNHWSCTSASPTAQLPSYDAIMNVVDSVTKCAHFIPTYTTITAKGTAHLYLREV
jgi:hypothetical protein